MASLDTAPSLKLGCALQDAMPKQAVVGKPTRCTSIVLRGAMPYPQDHLTRASHVRPSAPAADLRVQLIVALQCHNRE
eukprot:5292100-Amphidinium_carterae.1